MKSLMELLFCLLNELGKRCSASTAADQKTIRSRVDHEGLSFLTITMPSLCVDFEQALANGGIDSTLFIGQKKRGCLPAFLQGFTSQVFHSGTGKLLDSPNVDAIQAYRQITRLFSKLELPCSDARTYAAMKGYVECDAEVASFQFSDLQLREFENMAHKLFHSVFLEMDFLLLEDSLVPKHGPGATADKLNGNAKWTQSVWHERLEEHFPFGEYLFPSFRHFDADGIVLSPPEQELPVRVITVPKTLKTPRVIAVEPTCMQYAQQALLQSYVPLLERHTTLKHFIGFSDQEPNRFMAKRGSEDGSLATLDLSEASDRVSNRLVLSMLSRYPLFSGAIQASRSVRADVPGFGILPLSKYASMGSALCFPIEASVFLTVVLLGISRIAGPVTPRLLSQLRGKVRVYGDDIIVPNRYAQSVARELEAFGLKVNLHKSFWTGKFRESCGKEYYDGLDVSIVKFRRMLPQQRKHVSEIQSLASFRNQCYFSGLWETASWVDNYISRIIPWPVVAPTSEVIGRHSFLGYETQKECPHLQRSLVWGAVRKSSIPRSNLDGYGAMLKCFIVGGKGEIPITSSDHLRRAGRDQAPYIKLGWACPH